MRAGWRIIKGSALKILAFVVRFVLIVEVVYIIFM